jgi:16S rRNA (guanine966-N2)-methyltransferase
LRIIAGEWRGRPIAAPAGQATRPTSDRAREGLFSMLASRLGSFAGIEVADLFAGCGALGLEALSRGAAFSTFVEKDGSALAALKANVARLGAAGRVDVRAQGAEHAGPPRRPCDLILIDPPYGSEVVRAVLARIADAAWLAPGGWVSLETARGTAREEPPLPMDWDCLADRNFGKARIRLLRRAD